MLLSRAFSMTKPIQIKKFGGTSVGSIERIDNVAEIVIASFSTHSPVVVASAMSGETNRLVKLAHDVYPHYRGLAYDMLLASGEQVAISLLAMAIEKRGFKAKPYLAHQVGIMTDSMYSKARIQTIHTGALLKDIEKGIIPIVAGFQGVDEEANITTLGRGGSDTSAVALAVALKASECEIYTDVPAVFSADPRLVPKASEIHSLTFEEMMEMASLGSKVLHIRSVELAAKYGVKLHVRSSFDKREGTWVMELNQSMEKPVVAAVTHDANTVVIKVSPLPEGVDVLAEIFEVLSQKGVVVDIISQTQIAEGQRLAFSVPTEDLHSARELIQAMIPADTKIEVVEDVAKVSIVGVGMRNHPGVAAVFFKTLASSHVPISLVTTSEIKVSAIIPRQMLEVAAQSLHTQFGLDQK